MTALTFAKATKAQARARIAFEGPSGSGKTYTSLITARTLGKRIAVIDTEHGSASKYADEFDFDTLPLNRYNPEILVEALAVAAAEGYDVVVIDSLSHFWMGVDGMLEQVDKAAKRSGGGNTFAGWKEARPVERRMIEAILASPCHVIATMRQKTEWVIEENDRGKKVPKKIGLKAEQREGLEYEFDIVADMNIDNELIVSKTRCKALAGAVIRKPDEEFGRTVLAWLEDGTAAGPAGQELRDEALAAGSRDELLALYQRADRLGLLGAPVTDADGQAMSLGELVKALGKAKAAAARVEQAPTAEAPAVPAAPADDDSPAITDRMVKQLHTLFTNAKITARDDKLAFLNALMPDGRQITSTKDLSADEARTAIDALQAAINEQKDSDR